MLEFKESKFYKLLQDFFINNDKETFIQFLAEFYNKTEGIVIKNEMQDELIKELREMFLLFNEEGIDENIVIEKVNYFVENNEKIQDIITKIIKNTNNIKNITSQLDTIEKNKVDVIYPSGKLDDTDYLNIMNNIEKYNYVLLGSGTFNLTKPIKIDNGNCIIKGYGSSTLLKCLHDDFCIIQSRSGAGADEGLKISDLNILCQNGVKIGDIDLDVLDGTSDKQQPYVMRCHIENVNITNINNNMAGIGVMFAKVFDSSIDKCYIAGFEYGVRTKGCDIWNITNNRICLCSTLIYVESTLPNGTFGSQCNIMNNDLLNPNVAFIRSSDRCINIENNYMENTDETKVNSAIYIHDGYYIRIHQNRIENKNPIAYTTIFENNSSYYIYYVGNTSNNINISRGVKFLNPTALGYTYRYFKPIIIHFGNTVESGFPFNSNTDYDYSNTEKIVMAPMNGGLCSYAGGQYSPSRTAKVLNNSYVLENNSTMILSPTVINSSGANETTLKLVYSVLRNKSYKIGDIIRPNSNSCMMYYCTKNGTTSSNEVLYSEIKDEIVVDGTAEFTQFGVMATGNYKVTATLSCEGDNGSLITSFRTNDDVEITGQGVEVTGITKRKKQFILKERISEFNMSVKFYNSCGSKIYIENVVFEKL